MNSKILSGTTWRHQDGELYRILSMRIDNLVGDFNLVYYAPHDPERASEFVANGVRPIFCRTEDHFRDSFEKIGTDDRIKDINEIENLQTDMHGLKRRLNKCQEKLKELTCK